jgi:hypothetical protein
MTRLYFFAGKLLCSASWGALSDERTGIQFVVQSASGQSREGLVIIRVHYENRTEHTNTLRGQEQVVHCFERSRIGNIQRMSGSMWRPVAGSFSRRSVCLTQRLRLLSFLRRNGHLLHHEVLRAQWCSAVSSPPWEGNGSLASDYGLFSADPPSGGTVANGTQGEAAAPSTTFLV